MQCCAVCCVVFSCDCMTYGHVSDAISVQTVVSSVCSLAFPSQAVLAGPAGEHSFLATLFSGAFQSEADEDGCVFIDRDPALFRLILDGLRRGRMDPVLGRARREALLRELRFYGLPRLAAGVRGPVTLCLRGSTPATIAPFFKAGRYHQDIPLPPEALADEATIEWVGELDQRLVLMSVGVSDRCQILTYDPAARRWLWVGGDGTAGHSRCEIGPPEAGDFVRLGPQVVWEALDEGTGEVTAWAYNPRARFCGPVDLPVIPRSADTLDGTEYVGGQLHGSSHARVFRYAPDTNTFEDLWCPTECQDPDTLFVFCSSRRVFVMLQELGERCAELWEYDPGAPAWKALPQIRHPLGCCHWPSVDWRADSRSIYMWSSPDALYTHPCISDSEDMAPMVWDLYEPDYRNDWELRQRAFQIPVSFECAV